MKCSPRSRVATLDERRPSDPLKPLGKRTNSPASVNQIPNASAEIPREPCVGCRAIQRRPAGRRGTSIGLGCMSSMMPPNDFGIT